MIAPHLVLTFLSILLYTKAHTDLPKQPSPPPEVVTLTLEKFEEIFSSARLHDAERNLSTKIQNQNDEHKRRMADLEHEKKKLLYKDKHQRDAIFPENYAVLRHKIEGLFNSSSAGVERDAVSFDMEMTLRVLDSKWTVVPIMNTSSMVATDWNIEWKGDGTGGEEEYVSIDPVTTPDVLLILRDEREVLVTNRTGLFKVKFKAFTRIGKTRHLNTMSLSRLLYPLSEFSLAIITDDSTTVIKDLTVQPPSTILDVRRRPDENRTDIKATLPLASDYIQIRWIDSTANNKDNTKGGGEDGRGSTTPSFSSNKQHHNTTQKSSPVSNDDYIPPSTTVVHSALHTIGEGGIIQTSHRLEFSSTETDLSSSSSLNNQIQFILPDQNIRVTSVIAHGLRSWSVTDVPHQGSGDRKTGTIATSTLLTKKQLVTVAFKSSVMSSNVILQIHTEVTQPHLSTSSSSSSIITLPRLDCRDVIRQTGYVAVVANSINLEIHEDSSTTTTTSSSSSGALSRCKSSDIPSPIRLNIDKPIMLSYRYLHPDYRIVLNVREHILMTNQNNDLLEAIIDRYDYKAVLMKNGRHTMHSLIMALQNTKRQYLELGGLPKSSSLFTVAVNTVPTPPARGGGKKEGEGTTILIPLLAGVHRNFDDDDDEKGPSVTRTLVEVKYVSRHDDDNGNNYPAPVVSGSNGTFSISPPLVNGIPISIMTVHLNLPKSYEYNFTGDFGTTTSRDFSRDFGTTTTSRVPMYPPPDVRGMMAKRAGKRVVTDDHKFTMVDDFWPEDYDRSSSNDDDDYDDGEDRTRRGGGGAEGVTFNVPTSGRSFYFSKVFVVDQAPMINLTYKEVIRRPSSDARSVSWWWRFFK